MIEKFLDKIHQATFDKQHRSFDRGFQKFLNLFFDSIKQRVEQAEIEQRTKNLFLELRIHYSPIENKEQINLEMDFS